MVMLVHLAPAGAAKAIERDGIRKGRRRPGVYAMPVLPNFYASHQWMRELKRRGVRTFIGIYFRIDDDELVDVGRYHEPSRECRAAEAAAEIMHAGDPLGFQIVVRRAIDRSEIHDVRPVPRVIGWRYFPEAHGTVPCNCDFCKKGRINRRRIRAPRLT
jgi:hypothetical protein